MYTLHPVLASLIFAFACTPAAHSPNGDAGETSHASDAGIVADDEGFPHTPLEFDEVSKFGFSAKDAARWLEGTHEETFTFDDGTTTGLVITLQATKATLKQFGIHAPPPVSALTISQHRGLRFPGEALFFDVQVQVQTSDGQFNENVTGHIAVYEDRSSTLRLLLHDDIEGDYRDTIAALPPVYDSLALHANVDFLPPAKTVRMDGEIDMVRRVIGGDVEKVTVGTW